VSNSSYLGPTCCQHEDTVMAPIPANRATFKEFYATTYRDDHRHPANLALHIVGVIAGIAVLVTSVTVWPIWAALAFPVAHVVPGLIGHRLFDRDEAVGDVRITRTDYPLVWFLVANHMMAVRVLTGRW
jgi:hypothetical protein